MPKCMQVAIAIIWIMSPWNWYVGISTFKVMELQEKHVWDQSQTGSSPFYQMRTQGEKQFLSRPQAWIRITNQPEKTSRERLSQETLNQKWQGGKHSTSQGNEK